MGSISNCYSTGTVTSNDNSSGIGGLVGENDYPGGISNCYSTGVVNGGDDSYWIGGLVGANMSYISNCYSTGDVNGGDGSYRLGGLEGGNYGSVSNCYSTGKVEGDSKIGGLIGSNGDEYSSIAGYISNCYSTGQVSGDSNVGGLLGGNYYGGIISSSYFLDVSGPYNGYGTPLTDEEMKQQSSFVDWDFIGETANGTDDIWRMCVDGVEYPLLWWQFNKADLVCFDGVDSLDFAVLAYWWEYEYCEFYNDCDRADFDFSGTVDIQDLAILCDNWLKGISF
jgi:hypothetical protein